MCGACGLIRLDMGHLKQVKIQVKIQILNFFGRIFKFSNFHGEVLMNTFLLMYQLLTQD